MAPERAGARMSLAWGLYLLLGAVAGVLAGLLGVGGGLVLVAALVWLLPTQGVPAELAVHAALATALASILMTGLSSARAHHRRGSVSWPTVAWLVPGVLVGGWLGSLLATRLDGGLPARPDRRLLLPGRPAAGAGLATGPPRAGGCPPRPGLHRRRRIDRCDFRPGRHRRRQHDRAPAGLARPASGPGGRHVQRLWRGHRRGQRGGLCPAWPGPRPAAAGQLGLCLPAGRRRHRPGFGAHGAPGGRGSPTASAARPCEGCSPASCCWSAPACGGESERVVASH